MSTTNTSKQRQTSEYRERVSDYLNRGGTITQVPPSVSADRHDWRHLLASLQGWTETEQDRDFSLWELDHDTRVRVRAREEISSYDDHTS